MSWEILIALAAAAVFAIPFVQEIRRSAPDLRMAAGKFAKLSRGKTHYRWFGGARGPVAVCIHGLTTPSQVWEPLARELVDLGYRVLVYDLYGRGFSDNVSGLQTAEFFVEQLKELVDDQGLDGELTLFGYSMGGSIATAFTARHSHLVQRMVLIAPAGIGYKEDDVLRRVLRLSVLGTWLHALIEPVRMRRVIALEDTEGRQQLAEIRASQLGRSGYFPAIVSSRRGILRDVQEAEHRQISRLDIPVFAFWGKDDQVIPIRSLGLLAQWNRVALQEVIDGADHDLVVTHAPRLGALYRQFLRSE